MILTDREKTIAKSTAVVVGLFIIYAFVISPFMDELQSTKKKLSDAQARISNANILFDREKKLNTVWKAMLAGGLKDNFNDAETQAQQGINSLGEDVRVTVESFKKDRTTQENKFEVINFHVSAKSRMATVANMLWYMETAKIPIRINSIQFMPRTEGKDDLQIQMSISTLCVAASSDKKTASVTN